MKSLQQRIKEFHHNRNQQTVELKYKLMAGNEFTFYRATCHLFYQDLHGKPSLNQSPLGLLRLAGNLPVSCAVLAWLLTFGNIL